MTSQPLVTIITPTYNRANYIAETMESVLGQKYQNLEYIVLDDGSVDDTSSILKTYESRIIWERHANMGEANTVNKGFRMSHGDIIGIVNSDDPLLPNAIEKIVEFMRLHPDVGVVYPDWNVIDANGGVIQQVRAADYGYIDMLRWYRCLPGPGTFFRKNIVDALQGRDPQFKYVSDFDFWLRAGLITPFARLPQTLATFRVHPASTTVSQAGYAMAEEYIALIHKIYAQPDLLPEVLDVKKEAYSSAYYAAGYVCHSCDLPTRRAYFKKALLYAPFKYLFEYRRKRLFRVIIPVFFPLSSRVFHYTKQQAQKILTYFRKVSICSIR